MGKKTIIMHPTVAQAVNHWGEVLQGIPNLVKEARRNPLSIKLINGDIWYFRGETEGARAYRGYHAEMICVDDFDLITEVGNAFVREE